MRTDRVWLLRWAILTAVCLLWMLAAQPALARPSSQTRRTSTVFLPLVASYESVATPAADGEKVYGLVGQLTDAQGQTFASYFTSNDGVRYGLVGASADVEERIMALRTAGVAPTIKVWGSVQDQPSGNAASLIVATGVLATGVSTDLPAGPLVGTPIAVVRYSLVNLYGGPGTGFARAGQVKLNQTCDIIGRNLQNTWWEVRCYDGQAGWVDRRLVNSQGDIWRVPLIQVVVATATPVPQATPTATPVAVRDLGWRASFYNNVTLAGPPAAVATVGNVNFSWGTGSPAPAVVADGFSARFERTVDFQGGIYRFIVEADDGVRVWLDGQLLIDEWHGATGQLYSASRSIAGGRHVLMIEYYEAAGAASVRFRYEPGSETPVWRAEYFNGIDLYGQAALARSEPESQRPLDLNWSYSPPVESAAIGADYWSARWTGRFRFDKGDYIITAQADDGIRVYINDLLAIDGWRDGYKELSNRIIGIGAGTHTIRVEVYDRTGPALARVWWWRDRQVE